MSRQALVVGSTGIVGFNLAEHLVSRGWEVHGLARRPVDIKGVHSIQADLLDPPGLVKALKGVQPTHIFFTTWSRNPTEAENIAVNGAMMRNLLHVIRPKASVEHFALVTGLKHFIGPFEMYAKVSPPLTPFRETLPRLDIPNFYYDLEDQLFSAAGQDGFGWSVHRPHTMIGFAKTNVMNMGMTLAAYAAYCRETGKPFAFPGSEVQWNGVTDVTDARIFAQHLEWASTTPAARNQALHVTNGDVFRWKWMWGRLADYFGLQAVPFSKENKSLTEQMGDASATWAGIARKHDLVEPDLERIASFWHTDADLLRPFECITDMSKSRSLGFTASTPSDEAFFALFDRMQQERVIPAVAPNRELRVA